MDNLYALTLKTTRVTAFVTALVATATAISVGTPGILVWVGISALVAYYAHSRLGEVAEQSVQSKSRAMSI